MSRRLVVDAETYLFTAAAGASYEVSFAWNDWHHWTEHTTAQQVFTETLERLRQKANCDGLLVCFGHPVNFRYSVMPTYKRKRRNLRKPAGYKQLMEWAIETFEGLQLEGCEGDDVVGILASYGDVIASKDKDLKGIPGHHLIEGEVVEISHHSADMHHLQQTLSGDDVDGYPGCPGLGAVRAARLLENAADTRHGWELVVEAYEKAGQTREDALRNARVARILRRHEYDLGAALPLLWDPP